jgi:N-acetylmuramoyl-L-alanine amidase
MKKLFNGDVLKRIIPSLLALAAVVSLALFAAPGRPLPVSGLYTAPASASAITPSPEPSPAPAATPVPTPVSAPTPEPPPVDFAAADLTGVDAPVLEVLFRFWGFEYFAPDGKWTDADAYELRLFQHWAGLPETGGADGATRLALLRAWQAHRFGAVPRERLPLEGRYIGLNPGHQSRMDGQLEPLSPDKGSPMKARVSGGTRGVVTKVYEYQQNLVIALKLRDRLEAAGARVLMVRTENDVRISNGERARMMNDARVDACLSLHCNGNGNRNAKGLETLVPVERGNQRGAVLGESRRLAGLIQREAIKATGAKDLGLINRRDLTSLNWPEMPTCLIEMGYMTNPEEDRLLNSEEYQDKLVAGMVNAFVLFFQGT